MVRVRWRMWATVSIPSAEGCISYKKQSGKEGPRVTVKCRDTDSVSASASRPMTRKESRKQWAHVYVYVYGKLARVLLVPS